jgi:hypothetical protein
MPMNKWISQRHNRWMAFLPVLLMVLIGCLPAQAQRGGGGGGGGRGGGGGGGGFGGGSRGAIPEPSQGLGLPPSTKNSSLRLDMRVLEGKITADIVNCPLQKALQEMADRTGIIFEFRSHDNPTVSVHLNKVSQEEAIERIAQSHNIVLDYAQDDGHIKMAHVFPRAGTIQQPSLLYLGTGIVTKTNDDVDNPEQAIKALVENPRLEIRQKAIDLLKRNKSEEASKALLTAMNDQEPEIRLAAIGALVVFENHDAFPAILKCLKDTDPKVRQAAISVVVLWGNQKNIPDLRPLMTDKDAGIATEAQVAIEHLTRASASANASKLNN